METIEEIRETIKKAMLKAQIEVWCNSHGINPTIVTYENGKIIIPLSF